MCWLAAQVPAAASSRPKLGARSCLPFPRGWQGRSLLSHLLCAPGPGAGAEPVQVQKSRVGRWRLVCV